MTNVLEVTFCPPTDVHHPTHVICTSCCIWSTHRAWFGRLGCHLLVHWVQVIVPERAKSSGHGKMMGVEFSTSLASSSIDCPSLPSFLRRASSTTKRRRKCSSRYPGWRTLGLGAWLTHRHCTSTVSKGGRVSRQQAERGRPGFAIVVKAVMYFSTFRNEAFHSWIMGCGNEVKYFEYSCPWFEVLRNV